MGREQIRSLVAPFVVAPGSYLIRTTQFTGRELEALLTHVMGL